MQQKPEVTIDLVKLTAKIGNKSLGLSLTEMRIMIFFLSHKGKIVTRSEILAVMYPDDPNKNGAFSNIVDVYINHIRLKIGKERIATVKRSGYVFD